MWGLGLRLAGRQLFKQGAAPIAEGAASAGGSVMTGLRGFWGRITSSGVATATTNTAKAVAASPAGKAGAAAATATAGVGLYGLGLAATAATTIGLIALVGGGAFLGYKLLTGGSKETPESSVENSVSTPVMAPPSLGMAPNIPQMQVDSPVMAANALGNVTSAYPAAVVDYGPALQQSQPATNWRASVGGSRGAQSSFVDAEALRAQKAPIDPYRA